MACLPSQGRYATVDHEVFYRANTDRRRIGIALSSVFSVKSVVCFLGCGLAVRGFGLLLLEPVSQGILLSGWTQKQKNIELGLGLVFRAQAHVAGDEQHSARHTCGMNIEACPADQNTTET